MKNKFTFFYLFLLGFAILGCKPVQKELETTNSPMPERTAQPLELLVGTYTGGTSEGIYRLQFHPETGALGNLELVAATENPSYLQISKDRKHVFAVNELDPGAVSAFSWDDKKTELEILGSVSSEGKHPCYIALDENERYVAAANYSSGNVVVYPVDPQGQFKAIPQVRQHTGSGPTANQKSPHAHFAAFAADGKYLYVVDLGIDQVLSYPVDAEGNLGNAQVALQLDKGDGPRHLVFHPSKDLVFVVNELSSTVVSAHVDRDSGIFDKIGKVSTLPNNFTDKSYCADIHITANGQFLYASNRGHNSIAMFKVSEAGGMEFLGTESVRGDWPRNFTLAPGDTHLLVANQRSNNITVFKVDATTGLLQYTGTEIALDQPACLQF